MAYGFKDTNGVSEQEKGWGSFGKPSNGQGQERRSGNVEPFESWGEGQIKPSPPRRSGGASINQTKLADELEKKKRNSFGYFLIFEQFSLARWTCLLIPATSRRNSKKLAILSDLIAQ
jgi:hypothetical protein